MNFRTIITGFLLCTCGPSVLAQKNVPAQDMETVKEQFMQYRSSYEAGNRKTRFLRKYTDFALEHRNYRELEMVADSYLMKIPLKRRYTGKNWNIFEAGIKDCTSSSYRGLFSSWDRLDDSTRRKATAKITIDVKYCMFMERLKGRISQELETVIRKGLETVGLPDREYLAGLMDMARAIENNGSQEEILGLFKKYAVQKDFRNFNPSLLTDIAIWGCGLDKVLETADEATCRDVLRTLESMGTGNGKEGVFKTAYKNFEGKLMTFGNTGSNVPEQKLEYVDHVDGFFFNTSAGGVMTDKEYDILEKVYTSADDSLKEAYLFKVNRAFRYNGYTAGLERLKPLIEKNVKDSEAKREVLDFYRTYAHLAPGRQAPEFRLKDVNGKEHALSDFRGKVVVVDVWATWCCGCVAKLPYFLELWKKYRNRDDIAFMTISIDSRSSYNTWKYALPRYNLTEILSLIAPEDEGTFSKDYNITGVPRYYIIDKDGTIVTVYAPNPNNTKFEKMILEVLERK